MSAYFVSQATIDCIVTGGDKFRMRWGSRDQDHIGRRLWQENRRSLIERYSEDDAKKFWGKHFVKIRAYRWTRRPDALWQIVKCCDNYAYQTCEVHDWDTCGAKDYVDRVRACALNDLGVSEELQRNGLYAEHREYGAAAWGLEDLETTA